MEKAKSMLSGTSLEQKFWVEVVATTCYLINRSSTSTCVDKMPMEAWSGHKPSLRHLRVLGCEAYLHVLKEKQTKLENKDVKFIFIRYLVPFPEGRNPVGCKWVFKKKISSKRSIEKYKERLVAKGYSQVEGIDYGEIFSLVAKMTSIRFLLSIATTYDLEVEQMDVKTAFLHGDLEKDIYMTQSEHYVVKVGDVISLDIHGYEDLDRACDIDSRRSTSVYVFT
ncbi:hypothetical protein SUGI_1134750 [Cryptomeria japonica]|nr:hypothetical protein SUGI_1134750 [Cryptomeria japonica]